MCLSIFKHILSGRLNKMNADSSFIITMDKETANKLTKLGFQLLYNKDGQYTFLNCASINFTEEININTKKIAYTNVLSF